MNWHEATHPDQIHLLFLLCGVLILAAGARLLLHAVRQGLEYSNHGVLDRMLLGLLR